MIEEIAKGLHNPIFDVLVTTLATASKEYSDWVKLQTLKKDPTTAFFNIGPEAAIKAVKAATFEENQELLQEKQKSSLEQESEDEEEEEETKK